MQRIIKAPTGIHLSCKGWQQEAAFRMIQNNLDADVAENPEELISISFKAFVIDCIFP